MLDHDSPAVQTHLQLLQGVINRMAANSAACKTWCVTLVAAIFIVAFRSTVGVPPLLALAPIVVLLYQDSASLALERELRNAYNAFVAKLHAGTLTPADLFVVQPSAPLRARLSVLRSWSVLPFYALLTIGTVVLELID